jgi:hypothetical protein
LEKSNISGHSKYGRLYSASGWYIGLYPWVQ